MAFANSVRPGHTAILLIGEKDDGSVPGVTNPERVQHTVRKRCEQVYPAIVWRSKVYEKEGKTCVRVEIEYSGNTPHFGGPAWVRSGSSSVIASDAMFQKLIDLRSDKVFELAKWIGKTISIGPERLFVGGAPVSHARWFNEKEVTLKSVNRYWATFEMLDVFSDPKKFLQISEPIEKLILTFDDEHDGLMVRVKP